MTDFEDLHIHAPEIEKRLGYAFRDRTHLALAFVHRSYINEHREISIHNERLEFLGDSVLGLLIADHLYRQFPGKPEGELSMLRSRLVDSHTCMSFLLKLEIHQHLLLGKGEKLSEGRGRISILGDLFEAVIGAIYLDGGLEAAHNFLFGHFTQEIGTIIEQPLSNWKALFQDYCQRTYQQTPTYVVLGEEGPDHSKIFTISVKVGELEMGVGQGGSKKDAQQAAAEDALLRLKPAG